MSRTRFLTDEQRAVLAPLLPAQRPATGRPRRDDRQVLDGIIYRYRTGVAWRDLPERFGPWQTVCKRHRLRAGDATLDRVRQRLPAQADASGEVGWDVSVDSSVVRVHQHAANAPRDHTGGPTELPNYRNRLEEPTDHAIGRSRAGLSTKIHSMVDHACRGLVVLIGPGQAAIAPCSSR
ncbi:MULTISPECIES: IS5 family transposase [Actinomyces]|uniref:IS5 family transposase n=1 Tax=Actinomyces respiraculi TaxID=2744574 RepID=A0A7T0PWD0_9ACTO|nr:MULTISPECIES: IS5 family transposase [Actinomyces]QPL04715.1 IS5 family transposase [Actinomyces respiraculi]